MSGYALLCIVCANVLGGSAYALSGYALRGFSPAEVAFWRLVLGGLLFLPALLRTRKLRVSPRDWAGMAAVGLLGFGAPVLVGTLGQSLSSATNASLLIGMEPVSIVLLSAVFLREPLSWLKTGAVALGLSGSALIVLQGPFWSARVTPHLAGDLLLFLHGVLWSLYTVIGKSVLRRVDATSFSAWVTAFAIVPIALAGIPAMSARPMAAPPPESWAAVAMLGAGVTYLSTVLFNKGLELVPASQFANFIFLQPLVGVLLGVLLQGEPLTAWSAAGGALILSGVYAATRET